MKFVKHVKGHFTGLNYKIIDHSDLEPNCELPVTAYYETHDRWQYCGDFSNVSDAEYYINHRETLISNGDTVML